MFFLVIPFLFFFVNTFCFEEKKIVLVSCCYNVESSIIKTLDSIFSQQYDNFRVILVNDASTDQTKNLIDSYIEKIKDIKTIQCKVHHNEIRHRKLANLYKVIHECDPDEIVFLLDGDDWLVHDQVLARINTYYDDSSIWMTFGDYENYPAYVAKNWGVAEGSYCSSVSDDVIEQLLYRKKPFVYMHPRTFYAWLFHQVHLGDLITEKIPGFVGDFFPACNDLAMFFPMVELAGPHVQFIDEILYCRNIESELVGFKVDSALQRQAAYEIRRKKLYQPLISRPQQQPVSIKDLLLIIDDILISYGMDQFKVIGNLKKESLQKIIPILQKRFKYCAILEQKSGLINRINFSEIIQLLEKTHCSICLLEQKPGRNLPLTDSVFVWKRSLNVYLPVVTACVVSTTALVDWLGQKSEYKTIKEACNGYIQSFQYDAALSVFF